MDRPHGPPATARKSPHPGQSPAPPGEPWAAALPAELRYLHDQLPVGVFRARVTGGDRVTVEFANARAVAMVGGSPAPGGDLWEWFVSAFPDDRVAELVSGFRATAGESAPLRWEARTDRQPPRWVRLEGTVSPRQDADPGGVVVDGLLEDVTAARLLQEHLAAEAEARSRRSEELERLDHVRTSLLASVVHDLRTPLATITASADLLLARLGMPETQRRELVEEIAAAARSLSALLDNLLDVGRLQTGVFVADLGPTQLVDVLDCGHAFDWSQVDLSIPDDLPPLRADRGLLERVLCNLLHNAVRHSPAGARVELAAERTGDAILVRVVDHGPGLDPVNYAGMFAPFARFPESGPTGMGLGLTIAHGFTEAMGGRLTPSATPGGGLTMTVELGVSDDAPADR